MPKQALKTALITGASSGIGYELTKLFAQDKYNLVLVARNEDKLNEISQQLQQQHGLDQVTVIAKDLSKPNAPEEIYAELKQRGIEVQVLVNNAGFGEHGLFSETDLQAELAMIQVNVTSLVHLTKLLLRDMLSRKEGKILQLASSVSTMPTPLMAVYAATKAFVLSFSEALANELKDTGVTITALRPGATDTEFFDRAGAADTKVANSNLYDPADVAKDGYEALMKGERQVASGFATKLQTAASNVIAGEALTAGMRKMMEEKEGEK